MSFQDFKGIWKVIQADQGAEIEGHQVAIGGSPNAVKILCIDDPDGHPYGDAVYDPASDEIAGELFRISRAGGRPAEIRCTGPLAPGSWTADDNLG